MRTVPGERNSLGGSLQFGGGCALLVFMLPFVFVPVVGSEAIRDAVSPTTATWVCFGPMLIAVALVLLGSLLGTGQDHREEVHTLVVERDRLLVDGVEVKPAVTVDGERLLFDGLEVESSEISREDREAIVQAIGTLQRWRENVRGEVPEAMRELRGNLPETPE